MQNNEQQLLKSLRDDALDFPTMIPDEANWQIIRNSLPKQRVKVLSRIFPVGFAASILIFMFTVAFHSAHTSREINQLVLQSQKLEQRLGPDVNYMHDELLRWNLQIIDQKLIHTNSANEKKQLWKQRVDLLTITNNKIHVKKTYI